MSVPEPAQISRTEAASLDLVRTPKFVCGANQIDRELPGQKYAIYAVIPCKDAVPDSNGTLAFLKIRGVYESQKAAEEAAISLITDQDQLLTNTIVRVGVPFPLKNVNNCQDKIEVDIRQGVKAALANEAKKQKMADEKAQMEIETKRRALELEATETGESDPLTDYCILRSKLAQWVVCYNDMEKNKVELQDKIRKAHTQVLELDAANAQLSEQFLDKILQEEERCGFIKGKSEEMDKCIAARIDNLVNYKKHAENIL